MKATVKAMSPNKKINVIIILSIAFYAIIFTIMILGALIPSDSTTTAYRIPWYIWTAIGVAVLYIASIVIFIFVNKKSKNK